MQPAKFISANEAAVFLSVSLQTIYKWVHERRVPFRKHGKKLVFSLVDLQRWSDANAVLPIEAGDLQVDSMYCEPLGVHSTTSCSLTSGQGHRRTPKKGEQDGSD
jgi:excisionase family DNA binding protein